MPASKKARLQSVKAWNLRLVLETIRRSPGISRFDVAKVTGLDPATVGKLAAELIDRRFVCELGKGASSGGRRPVQLSVLGSPYRFLTVKLLRDCLEFDLLDFCFQTLASRRVACPEPLAPAALERCMVENLDIAQGRPLLGGAVGLAGVADRGRGLVLRCACLDGSDFPAGAILADALRVPTIVENLTRAQAWRESHAAGGTSDLVLLHAGAGIGAALVHAGQLLRGAAGFAGEIGHTILEPDGPPCPMGHAGCLESLANIEAFERDLAAALKRPVRYTDIDAVCAKSKRCRAVLEEKAALLSTPLTFLIDAFDPEEVVLTGPLFESGDALFQSVRGMVERRTFTGNGASCTRVRRSLRGETRDQQSLAGLLWDEVTMQVLEKKG
jgi:predicted NBD/HSP70 family sugar kinase